MAISTGSLPIFEETCAEWLRRLVDDNSAAASELRCEARRLIASLQDWRHTAPSEAARAETLSKVFDFHRRALEYATRGKP